MAARPDDSASSARDEVFRRFDVRTPLRPSYVVWELTLACDQPCTHCGSRAGTAREGELTTAQALGVVDQLAAMGTFEVVLIGGEAYLHPGFLELVRALRSKNIRPTMTTGGRGITPALARSMREAGLHSVSVSIDGLEVTHDLMRASPGSFASATAALHAFRDVGLRTAANTNFNRLNQADAEPLYEHLRACGISAWQVMLTTPIGRASDRPAMLLQPWDLLDLMPRLVALKERGFVDGVLLMPGNNLGYFGPEETALRSPAKGMTDHWMGCQAGKYVMGIEADGGVKGCPSLQSRHYLGGSLANQSLEAIWNETKPLAFARARTVDDLWGFCRSCPFAATCLGGCTFTAHAFFGRPGNNPYCHFRARALQAEGKRERLVLKEAAPGEPFDNGLFELVEEPFDAPDPRPPTPRELVKVTKLPRPKA
ncbi:MAG: radical SAM protein [Myxococcaceae bacterium]|nr:radical SAM protein [Myxococcaceae bacterium]